MISHVQMKRGHLNWRLRAELIRGCGNRRFAKLIPVYGEGGMMRQIREPYRKEDERVSGDCAVTNTETRNARMAKSAIGYPSIPNGAEGQRDFGFAQSVSRTRPLYYASDDWADVRDAAGTEEIAGGGDSSSLMVRKHGTAQMIHHFPHALSNSR